MYLTVTGCALLTSDVYETIEILIFFRSNLPSTLSGDRTYVAPQSYILK